MLTVTKRPYARIFVGTFVKIDVSCDQNVAAVEDNFDMALRATLESYSPKNLPTMGTDTPPEVGKDLLTAKMSTGALESVRFSSFATALSSTDADIDVIFQRTVVQRKIRKCR